MDSPGTTKTPNLVARLMGLDLLPETNSPSSSTSNPKPHSKSHLKNSNTRSSRGFYDDDISVGARSLPETPRVSSSRRSDVEYHRLSLQIQKDNTNEVFAVPIKTTRSRFRQDEDSSPSHYAKQIVKQVKESVSKRIGLLDITNANRDEVRRDQNLLLKLSKKNSDDTPPAPPKLKRNRPATETTAISPRNSTSPNNSKNLPANQEHQFKEKKSTSDQVIRSKKEGGFVRPAAANSKKASLSNELLHSSGPTILRVKKDPSPPATKLPQKQGQLSDALSSKRSTQLSSSTSRSYKQLPLQTGKISTVLQKVLPDSTNGCATASAASEYKCYIHKILKRVGVIDKITPLTLGKWHTPSHPLEPSIFYYLELFHPASAATGAVLSHKCNRKLIFQLTDELLVDILRPHLDYKPWGSPVVRTNNFGLIDEIKGVSVTET